MREWNLERFAGFFELISDATIASDEAGNILLANDEAVHLFGYSHDELMAMTVFDLTPEDRRAALAAERDDFFSSSDAKLKGRHERHSVRCADGVEFPVEMSFSRVKTPGGVVRVAVLRDIREKLQSEAERDDLRSQLEISQMRRMEALGQLAGGIAHDFNNLLGVIINYADFAITELEDQPAIRDDIEQILVAANRAAELTQQLLVFGRRKDESRRPLDLNEVIRDIEKLMRRAVGEHIELITDFDPDLAQVMADPTQLERAVINLAINARDAMPNGGTLKIETRNVTLDSEYLASRFWEIPPGQYVLLSVSDTGSGMDHMTLQSAFEPFFTTREAAGTGLGLATVYGTVKSLGGEVYLYSEVGQGTSVKIHLPASNADVEQLAAPEPEPAERGRGERVLVVEDELSMRRMIVRALSENGYEVVDCALASDALELLMDSRETFAILLTDVVMPKIPGSDLAKRAREVRPRLPVLFMSGYSELALKQVDGDGEQIDLLEKPFTVSALLTETRRVLEGTPR